MKNIIKRLSGSKENSTKNEKKFRTLIGQTLYDLKSHGINDFIKYDLNDGTEETINLENAIKSKDIFEQFQGWLNQLLFSLQDFKKEVKLNI